MDSKYRILYTETAVQDMEEKADYIILQFKDPVLAQKWYFRLRDSIQRSLSTFPLKYPLYDRVPWSEKGIRLFPTQNDVVLYQVDESSHIVSIWGICTRGRDLSAHLENCDQSF